MALTPITVRKNGDVMKSAIITLLFVLALVTTSAAQTQEQLIGRRPRKRQARRLRFGDRAATANVFCHVQQKVPIYQNGIFSHRKAEARQ